MYVDILTNTILTIKIRFLTLIVATRPNLQKTYHSWQHIVEIQMLYTKVKVHTTSAVNQITDAHNFEQCTFIHPNQNHKICSEFMIVQLANSLLSSKESLRLLRKSVDNHKIQTPSSNPNSDL